MLRYAYAGDLSALAGEFRTRIAAGEHGAAILEALSVLETRFCDGEKVEGYRRDRPVACAIFTLHAGASTDERIREQRYVSALVTEFLRLVRQ